MLDDPGLDLTLARDGQRYGDNVPLVAGELMELARSGWTLVIRHAERHNVPLAEVAVAFERAFRGEVDVQIFVTPSGQRGFSWHYDAEDVFILQSSGCKKYDLRKNTVNPWPLVETLPTDMHYEREMMPLSQAVLQAGDLLYIPCGYWHRAEAQDHSKTSISLAIGVQSPAAIDLFDFLRAELVSSLVWRQRLPLAGEGDPREIYEPLLRALATEISRKLTSSATLNSIVERFGRFERDVGK
jgi:50S ribosomal protein L16 3-hydroxylase